MNIDKLIENLRLAVSVSEELKQLGIVGVFLSLDEGTPRFTLHTEGFKKLCKGRHVVVRTGLCGGAMMNWRGAVLFASLSDSEVMAFVEEGE